ncbi:MAG: hypothetical protein WBN99_04560 [Mycobacterium sp.]
MKVSREGPGQVDGTVHRHIGTVFRPTVGDTPIGHSRWPPATPESAAAEAAEPVFGLFARKELKSDEF